MEIKIDNGDYCEYIYLEKVANATNGSVLYKQGKSVILATVVMDTNEVVDGEFLPLTVQYIERSYANGKIPGGYIKREGKPSEFEILTSRLIDRSLRPLFTKSYKHPIQITILVLSADTLLDLQTISLNAASIALFISNIPINRPVNAVRIGLVDDNFIINPNLEQMKSSSVDLFVSGELNDIFMIEFMSKSHQLSEDKLLDAISLAQEHINIRSNLYKKYLSKYIKPHIDVSEGSSCIDSSVHDLVVSEYSDLLLSNIKDMINSDNDSSLSVIVSNIASKHSLNEQDVKSSVYKIRRDYIRSQILDYENRPDGRRLNEVRKISIETNILPNAHGSTLFTRGQTQVLAVCTIGNDNDMQHYDVLTSKYPSKSKFSFHYNFPSFSTGEAYPMGSVSRRELGHGNLARKALESSFLDDNRVVRIVSEVLESNGSSSMASVCAGSLSLFSAGIEASFLVAGIAMGLVKDGSRYKILTDIIGVEDADGDMDFKIAGNSYGITALQLDTKTIGIDIGILRDSVFQGREAISHILDIMELAKTNIVINENTPLSQYFKVPMGKISSIIGQGGRNIKDIVEKFKVSININKDNGEVRIDSTIRDDILRAKEYILSSIFINSDSFKVGDQFSGRVKRISDFGVFIELKDGVDGLVHNSKLNKQNINIDSIIEGNILNVEIISINDNKIELDIV